LTNSEEEKEDFCAYCMNCKIKTIFRKDHTHLKVFDTAPDGSIHENPTVFIFASCKECQHPALFMQYDFIATNEDKFSLSERIYPQQKRKLDYLLPNVIRESYYEAINCEENHAWLACLVMVGRTLEAVAREYYPTVTNFFTGLETMHNNGLISKEILDWSHMLRKLRNISAHPSNEKVTEEDATDALDFLQVILDIIYKYRPKFERLKERREDAS